MFRRKLKALNYHSPDEELPPAEVEGLKPLVVWLEDQKIRCYKIEERTPLRQEEGKQWVSYFRKYLKSLECPYGLETDLPAVLDWLLGVAVRYEFGELAERNPDMRGGIVSGEQKRQGVVLPTQSSSSSPPTKSPLDIDPSDPTFISGTQALAKILQIATPHPDPALLLEAIALVVCEKLSETALAEGARSDAPAPSGGDTKKFNISARECGFDLGDPVLSEAAKVLRLLHIQELRQLQTNINELIVAVQAITANPKTDQSLGQVGR